MILVDTSIWVDHFRHGDQTLVELLSSGHVVMHPFVRGELALGNLKPRAEILQLLSDLPQATVADEKELLHIVESRKMMGLGIGLIDAHLIASALLDACTLFTRDKRLLAVATRLKLAFR
ncbi:MAG TPA: type II toxin-antitoxin system VapC family toxin [Usitatibacteraceae bacterium]